MSSRPRSVLPASLSAIFGVVALAGALVGVSAPAQADGDACTATRFQVPEVERACKEGGRVAAKKMMNDAMKKAKAAGESVNCKTCHTDVKDSFALKPAAVAELQRILKL